MSDQSIFIDAQTLAAQLGQPGLRIVDGAWYLPSQQRDAKREYAEGHIPGAVFFDHDVIVEPGSTLPHTLPSPENFAKFAGQLGISETDRIVVYDGFGLFSAPRTRWMFKVMGAKNVLILEGGLDGWKREGRAVTAEPTRIIPAKFKPDFDSGRVATLGDMRAIVTEGLAQIADARPAGRFAGKDPEPRPGLRGGHMPGAVNLAFSGFSSQGRMIEKDQLRALLVSSGLDLSKPVVTTCGSGVSAAIISLALEMVGHGDNRLYDGSWAEWGALPDVPVVKDA